MYPKSRIKWSIESGPKNECKTNIGNWLFWSPVSVVTDAAVPGRRSKIWQSTLTGYSGWQVPSSILPQKQKVIKLAIESGENLHKTANNRETITSSNKNDEANEVRRDRTEIKADLTKYRGKAKSSKMIKRSAEIAIANQSKGCKRAKRSEELEERVDEAASDMTYHSKRFQNSPLTNEDKVVGELVETEMIKEEQIAERIKGKSQCQECGEDEGETKQTDLIAENDLLAEWIYWIKEIGLLDTYLSLDQQNSNHNDYNDSSYNENKNNNSLASYREGIPEDDEGKRSQLSRTHLILKPIGVSVAGDGGTAIAMPLARAVVVQRKGWQKDVVVDFEPLSVAIAGARGKAYAYSDLELNLILSKESHFNQRNLVMPYYGGLSGHYLELKDGKIHRIIDVSGHEKNSTKPTNTTNAPKDPELNNNDKNSNSNAGDKPNSTGNSFGSNSSFDHLSGATFYDDFNRIQLAAARLVAIQDMAKRKGSFSSDDNRIYANSLLELGQAAQNLAQLQQNGHIKDFSVLLQPMQLSNSEKSDILDRDSLMPQKTPPATTTSFSSSTSLSAAASASDLGEIHDQLISEQMFDEVNDTAFYHETDILPGLDFESPTDPFEDLQDSVALTPPCNDASVAEAKPMSISIVGEGGVASAKPNAIALTGKNGLAVTAPKATAIAGISPKEAAAFTYRFPNRNHLVIKQNQSLKPKQRPSAAVRPATDYSYDFIESSSAFGAERGALRARSNNRVQPLIATASAMNAVMQVWQNALLAANRSQPLHQTPEATVGRM